MTLKTCAVTISDISGVLHTVEVSADTLFEAVARALVSLQSDLWVGDIGRRLTTATVIVRNPEIRHQVKISEFESWLNSSGKSPAEMTLKLRLRSLLPKKP